MDPLKMSVAVFPHTKITSFGRCQKEGMPVNFGEIMTWEDALAKHYPSDAMVVGYCIVDEAKTPRLSKRDERQIQSMGKEVGVTTLMIDYDRPKVEGKKNPWENEMEPWDTLAKLIDNPELWPTVFYTTKHGARLVYVLARTLATHEAEEAYLVLIEKLRALGIESDENTKDWTRMMALPFITKSEVDDAGMVLSEELLWENSSIFVETFPDSVLNPDLLLTSKSKVFEPCLIDGEKPDANMCDRALWIDSKQTPTHRRAKELLKNNSFAAYLFAGHGCDFREGERDSKINAMVWTVVRTLVGKRGMEEIGPEFPFAVMHKGVSQMTPDADEPDKDWTEVLWDKVCRIWEQTIDEDEQKALSTEQVEQKALIGWKDQLRRDEVSLRGLMAKSGLDSEVKLMKRHLMLCSGRGEVFLLTPDGNYRTRATPTVSIHGAVEMMGLADLYDLKKFGERVSETDLKRDHSIPIDEVIGQLGLDKGVLSGLSSDSVKLSIPTYFLQDLDPLFVPEVDQWLQVLAGDNYERITDWLAHSQDIARPICALSLTGGPGAGKSFLAELVGARFGPGMKNSEQIFGKWNYRLRDNPVIHIDEGLHGHNIDAKFREFVTGGNLTLSQRNVDERSYEVYPRIIIAANSLEALHHIVASRDLDDDSHYALAERILHIEVRDQARVLVVRDETENWIRGDRLALRHLAWLYENRTSPSKWAGAGRFVVEGDRHSEMLQESRFNSPMVEAVQRVLLKVVESAGNMAAGAEVVDDQVHASASRVSEMMNHMAHDFYGLPKSPKAIGMALKKLSGGKGHSNPVRVWYVSVEVLLRYAIETGADCDRLRKIYVESYGEACLRSLEKGQ